MYVTVKYLMFKLTDTALDSLFVGEFNKEKDRKYFLKGTRINQWKIEKMGNYENRVNRDRQD